MSVTITKQGLFTVRSQVVTRIQKVAVQPHNILQH